MTAEDLQEVDLLAGRALPGDRRFAIARATAPIDPAEPTWQPKTHFVTLMKEERLARLNSRFDPEKGQLTIFRRGKQVCQARVSEATGRMIVDQFFAAFLGDTGAGAPKMVDAGERAMSDSPDPVISLINLESIRDLERVIGKPLDPLRFRANLYVEGLPAWAEMAWIGEEVTIGGMPLKAVEAIERCAATTVNPESAERDINVPKALQRGYRHNCMGVYCEVVQAGRVEVGAEVVPPSA
jgi:uncharacterized protein YcbX